jgi:hypothetical protein
MRIVALNLSNGCCYLVSCSLWLATSSSATFILGCYFSGFSTGGYFNSAISFAIRYLSNLYFSKLSPSLKFSYASFARSSSDSFSLILATSYDFSKVYNLTKIQIKLSCTYVSIFMSHLFQGLWMISMMIAALGPYL